MGRPGGIGQVTLSGKLAGGDNWATSFWLPQTGSEPVNDADAVAFRDSIGMQRVLAVLRTCLSAFSSIDQLTLRKYPVANQPANSTGIASISLAGTGQGTLPNQCALVVSLRTNLGSARGRGRMYMPCNGAQVAPSTAKLGAVDRNELAAAWAGLAATSQMGVLSQKDSLLRPVTQVQVGDVIDTVRARRDKLVESYVTKPVNP